MVELFFSYYTFWYAEIMENTIPISISIALLNI